MRTMALTFEGHKKLDPVQQVGKEELDDACECGWIGDSSIGYTHSSHIAEVIGDEYDD